MVYAMAARNATTGSDIKLLLATGFCGGFTTFSAFAFENLELFKSGMHMTALMYVILSVTLGILAVVSWCIPDQIKWNPKNRQWKQSYTWS